MLERNAKYLRGFLVRSRFLLVLLVFLPLSAVAKMPEGASVVTDFSLERYLGTWYEIARLDHRFERGLTQVTATFHWYCRYFMGRRHDDDERQIKRWRNMTRHISQLKKNCMRGDLLCRPRQRQALLHWAYDSREF